MSPYRVLICADPSTAERVAGVLESHGYSADTATDPGTALVLAEETRPDVVLSWSDLLGPRAPQLVRRLRERSSEVRVAAVIGRGDAEAAPVLLQAGADALLLDDADLEYLAWTVDRLVEGGLVVDPVLARSLVASPREGTPPTRADGADAAEEPLSDDLPEYEPGVDFQECDVAETVHEGAAEAAHAYAAVMVQVTAPQMLVAVAEPDALRGVVRILVDNACRGSEAGSHVLVKAARVDAGVSVHVVDRRSGTGRDPGGSAEGLNLARSLVALHGGILWSEPLPSGGTRASFTIPEKPPILTGVELQEAILTLDVLKQMELQEQPVAEPEEDGSEYQEELRHEAELAAAAAEVALREHEPSGPGVDSERDAEPETAPELGEDAADAPVVAEVGLAVEDAEDERIAAEAGDPQAEAVDPPERRESEPAAAAEERAFDEEPADLRQPVDVRPVAPAEERAFEAEPVDLREPVDVAPVPAAEEPVDSVGAAEADEALAVEAVVVLEPKADEDPSLDDADRSHAPEDGGAPIPEPVAARAGTEDRDSPARGHIAPIKAFVPDPLHPAMSLLRSLVEDYEAESHGPGRR